MLHSKSSSSNSPVAILTHEGVRSLNNKGKAIKGVEQSTHPKVPVEHLPVWIFPPSPKQGEVWPCAVLHPRALPMPVILESEDALNNY